jgi:hypothetical protein
MKRRRAVSIAPGIDRRHDEATIHRRRMSMRFMMIVKATQDSEAGKMPDEKLLSDMMKYNEELAKAGVLLDLAGLQPSSKGARIKFKGTKRTVVDGPFTEAKELIAGFWLIQVKSKEEAIEWARRCPCPMPDEAESEIEIRPLFDVSDFPAANAETLATAASIEQQIRKS